MYRILFVLLLVVFSWTTGFSQVNVTVEMIPPQYNVNTDEFPLLKLSVRVTESSNQVELKQNQFYILEGAMVCEPLELTPIQDGWQTITYYTKLHDFTFIGEYQAELLTVYKDIPYRRFLAGRLEWLPLLNIFSGTNNQQLRNANWPLVQPGNSIPFSIKLNGLLRNTRTNQEKPIRIDSLTTQTPFFTIKWLGPFIGEKREPPAEIAAGFDYLINIYFTPLANTYYQDVLTVHFNNGMKRHIPLYGNSFKVDIEKLLVITEPVPGTVFSPCETATIKWRGHDPSNPVELYYTTNAGLEWKLIDIVLDSTYNWKIPNVETRSFKFRIRQDFKNSKEQIISEDRFPVYSVNYNYSGTKVSSINSMGKVLTWNLATGGNAEFLRRQYLEENTDESIERFRSFGIEYSLNEEKFYVGYRNYTLPEFLQIDSIAVFDSQSTYPVKKFALPAGFKAKTTKSDRLKKYIAVFPEYGSKILQYSMENETLIREITFPAPIMDIAFNTNSDSAAVLLINGRIKFVRLDDFTIFDNLDFDIFPNFLNIAYSPNGRFLSIGTQSDNSGLKTNIYLIDIAAKRIARVFNPSAGDPVNIQFNPTSTALIVGSKTDKQIAIYDLTTNLNSSSLFGHTDNMTDLKMSPSGFSIVSTSIANMDNIVYRTFTYPQEDQSAGNLIIELPKITEQKVQIQQAYHGTFNKYEITTICNVGRSMADIFDAHFKSSINIKLSEEWKRDTINPGDCFKFEIMYNPIDTGIIRDTLIFTHCSRLYYIPFEAYSIPRAITLLNNGFDYGDVCIGDTLTREFPLFRNDDPVPLIVNYAVINENEEFFDNIFSVNDTVLQPGEVFIARIRFIPTELGEHDADIFIHHSNQTKIFTTSKIQGTGIGSFVDISHDALRFIPEILTREIKIKNAGLTDILFENFRVSLPNVFEVLTPAGFNLKPGEEKTIVIRWNGIDETPAQFIIDANPCLVQRFIPLDFYRGTSVITLPTIVTEAYNEKVRIPIIYSNTDNGNYGGVRGFTSEFTVNSKIFLPTSVESKHGKAELISNTVSAGIRTFGIRVEGDFPKDDTLATIIGVAGLTDTDRSPLIMLNKLGWSRFVNMVINTGEIIISGICEDRYVIKNNQIISDMLVIPNPASNQAKLRFELTENADIKCEVIDNIGNAILICKDFTGQTGENIIEMNLVSFGTGNYKVRLSTPNDFSVINLIIIK